MNSSTQDTSPRKESTEKTAPIVGRVLADVGSLVFGAGLGPKYTTFIFGVEKSGGAIMPVKVSYTFFKSQGPPPDSFFDHSKLYELRAGREPNCDETLSSLAQIENVDESGRPLPPTDALRVLEGAPRDILQPDLLLPCYVLRAGKYKVLSKNRSNRSFRQECAECRRRVKSLRLCCDERVGNASLLDRSASPLLK